MLWGITSAQNKNEGEILMPRNTLTVVASNAPPFLAARLLRFDRFFGGRLCDGLSCRHLQSSRGPDT